MFIRAEDTTSPKGLVFFEQQVSENWFVKGIFYPNKDRNDACFAVRDYRDGSTIEIQKDLIDSELAIWSQSMSWNSGGEKGKTYKMRVNMYAASGRFIGTSRPSPGDASNQGAGTAGSAEKEGDATNPGGTMKK